MYRDFLKVKGVNLTVKELKKKNKEENLYDVEIIDEFLRIVTKMKSFNCCTRMGRRKEWIYNFI